MKNELKVVEKDKRIKMKGIDRFTDKAQKYEKYRPSYPNKSLDIIQDECGLALNNDIVIADIGSGTGKFTELLLEKGCVVYAVEPNDNMRAVAEAKFADIHNYKSINNTAEDTGLDDSSIDLITVAQAFHYFNLDKAREEFRRILKPNGKVVLLWNFRYRESDFMKEYEKIVYTFHSKDLQPTFAQDKMNDNVYNKLFSEYKVFSIPYCQELDFNNLWGRVLSSNHAPKADDPNYDELYRKIRGLFDKYQHNNKITFEYRTKIVLGSIEESKELEKVGE